MITFLAQAFNVVASVVQYLLQFTSFIGNVIVVLISSVLSCIINSIRSIILFFQIVYEDNVYIFTEDLPHWTKQYLDVIIDQYFYIINVLWLLCSEVMLQLATGINLIKYVTRAILIELWESLILLKKLILLIGDAFWFLLTFIPVHLPYIVKTLSKYVTEAVVSYTYDLYKTLLRFTNFLSDMPLESFMGIMTAIAIVRFYLSFQVEIHLKIVNLYWILLRRLWYMYHTVYNYLTNSDVRVITRVDNGELIITQGVNLEEDIEEVTNAVDALCVICQERQKCVLILPCKHVCLCRECCLQLYGYQRTCPICRTFIYHSVTIYL